MTDTEAPARQEAFRVVGQSPAHHDFVDKVSGSLLYAADWQLPGMLHGSVVRAEVASARIAAMDTSAARALPAVCARMRCGMPSACMKNLRPAMLVAITAVRVTVAPAIVPATVIGATLTNCLAARAHRQAFSPQISR